MVPVLLFIWHRFLQPIFLKFWNPWGKVTAGAEKKVEEKQGGKECPASNGTVVPSGEMSCPFSGKDVKQAEVVTGDKKSD